MSRIKSTISFFKEYETGIIEVAAIVTSSLRWVITFMPVDGLEFRLAETFPLWEGLSAVLSVAFAIVEVYATAFMMRAWNRATARRDKWVLGSLWIASLIVMVAVQFPPLYANVMKQSVNTLPQWMVAGWIISISLSTFVVIAGVSYADNVYSQKTKAEVKVDLPYVPVKKDEDVSRPVPASSPKRAPSKNAAMSIGEFTQKMDDLGDKAPKTIGEVERDFGLSHSTADRRLKEYKKIKG